MGWQETILDKIEKASLKKWLLSISGYFFSLLQKKNCWYLFNLKKGKCLKGQKGSFLGDMGLQKCKCVCVYRCV